MTADNAATTIGETLAWAARRAGIPAFVKIAHRDDIVAIEALDGSLFKLRVTAVDQILWPEREEEQ